MRIGLHWEEIRTAKTERGAAKISMQFKEFPSMARSEWGMWCAHWKSQAPYFATQQILTSTLINPDTIFLGINRRKVKYDPHYWERKRKSVNAGRSRFMGYFLRDFGVIRLENLKCFLNSCVNFQFNTIWHRRSAAALIFCTRLAESDITVTPSVTWMDLLRWWYNHTAHVVSSSRSLVFLDNMTEKHKSTSPSAIQVANLRKIISSEDKLDVISRLERGEQIADTCH